VWKKKKAEQFDPERRRRPRRGIWHRRSNLAVSITLICIVQKIRI